MTAKQGLGLVVALLCAGLGVGSALVVASFIGGSQVRCGLNPLIMTFYVAVAGVCFAALIGLSAPAKDSRRSKKRRAWMAVFVGSLAVLGWLWWLGPQCEVVAR